MRRQAETWQHSLRGRTPDPEEGTGGLRAINLSFNPGIGDDGAYEMLHALEDDTWTQSEPPHTHTFIAAVCFAPCAHSWVSATVARLTPFAPARMLPLQS